MKRVRAFLLAATGLCFCFTSSTVRASILVTPETNPMNLATAVLGGGGITINGITVNGHTLGSGASSTGTFLVSGANPFGLGNGSTGIVLSTGDVRDYASPNPNAGGSSRSTNFNSGAQGYTTLEGGTVPTGVGGVPATPAQIALLTPISGPTNKYDVTQIDISYTLPPNRNAITFDVVFGSEEYPEFVNAGFNDAFGLFASGQNIAFTASLPINIDHPNMIGYPGTELDGVLAPLGNSILSFSKISGPGSSGTLTFILGDLGDGIFDTTIYIRGLTGTTIPEPGSCCVAGITVIFGGLYALRRKARERR